MTSLGAVLSLRNTINNILHCSRFSLIGGSQQIIQVVYKELEPWQEILKRLDETSPSRNRTKVNALDGRIKDAIWKFEDSMESLLIQHINPSQNEDTFIFSIDLQSLQNEVHSFIQELEDTKKDYIYEVENMPQDEPISSSIDFHGTNSKMIGLSDQFQLLKTELMRGDRGSDCFHALRGTAGVGKTTLAMQIYQDTDIQSKFECRAWVTVGRVPQPSSQISRGILAQLCGITQVDEEIGEDCLQQRLYGKICFVVFDDVWEMDVLDSFLNITYYVPHFHFLLICRHTKWHRDAWSSWTPDFSWYEMRFLNEEESTELLCEKVFGDEICPPHLQKAAVKIAKLCEGLPLTIVTVADILSKSEQNRD